MREVKKNVNATEIKCNVYYYLELIKIKPFVVEPCTSRILLEKGYYGVFKCDKRDLLIHVNKNFSLSVI